MDPSRQLYDTIRQDRQLTASLYRQALNDPGGTVKRLVALAAERGLSVSADDVRRFVAELTIPVAAAGWTRLVGAFDPLIPRSLSGLDVGRVSTHGQVDRVPQR